MHWDTAFWAGVGLTIMSLTCWILIFIATIITHFYFLHSGIKTYELKNLPLQNGQKTPVSAAQEVTDPAILSLIGR